LQGAEATLLMLLYYYFFSFLQLLSSLNHILIAKLSSNLILVALSGWSDIISITVSAELCSLVKKTFAQSGFILYFSSISIHTLSAVISVFLFKYFHHIEIIELSQIQISNHKDIIVN
jgi:hypothetical protein